MAKQKKKRNKPYQGADAKSARPEVVRISAANRSAPQQWIYEHRKLIKPVSLVTGIIVFIIILVIGIIGMVNS